MPLASRENDLVAFLESKAARKVLHEYSVGFHV